MHGKKSLLIVLSAAPYNGSDAAYNALRLANTALDSGNAVRIFLINDGIDVGRKNAAIPEGGMDLSEMLKKSAKNGADVKYCKTCVDRCGLGKGDMMDEIAVGSMKELHEWIMASDRAVTF